MRKGRKRELGVKMQKGVYGGVQGGNVYPRPVKGGASPPLELRAITLFKS